MKKPWVLSYPLSAQRRLRSDRADFVGFVMLWLNRVNSVRLFLDDRVEVGEYNNHKLVEVGLNTEVSIIHSGVQIFIWEMNCCLYDQGFCLTEILFTGDVLVGL